MSSAAEITESPSVSSNDLKPKLCRRVHRGVGTSTAVSNENQYCVYTTIIAPMKNDFPQFPVPGIDNKMYIILYYYSFGFRRVPPPFPSQVPRLTLTSNPRCFHSLPLNSSVSPFIVDLYIYIYVGTLTPHRVTVVGNAFSLCQRRYVRREPVQDRRQQIREELSNKNFSTYILIQTYTNRIIHIYIYTISPAQSFRPHKLLIFEFFVLYEHQLQVIFVILFFVVSRHVYTFYYFQDDSPSACALQIFNNELI